MRYRQMATAFAFLLSLTAQAVSGSTDRGIDERAVRPGNVGPNSDLNSQVSPTSPNIPTTAQPPPEIAPGNGSTRSEHWRERFQRTIQSQSAFETPTGLVRGPRHVATKRPAKLRVGFFVFRVHVSTMLSRGGASRGGDLPEKQQVGRSLPVTRISLRPDRFPPAASIVGVLQRGHCG